MVECSQGRFMVQIEEQTGYVKQIRLRDDPTQANWMEPEYEWGRVYGYSDPEDIQFDGGSVTVRYSGPVSLTITRVLEDEAFVERYLFHNEKPVDHFIREGEWGIYLPFNSNTTDRSQDLYNTRFFPNFWCGGDICYATTTRMNGQFPWLLTYLTKGRVNSYSQEKDFKSGNDFGGVRTLNPAPRAIPPGGYMEIVLRHTFEEKPLPEALENYPGFIGLSAEYYSVYVGEELHLTGTYSGRIDSCRVTLEGKPVPHRLEDGKIRADYLCESPGEKLFRFTVNGKTTWIVTNVLLPLDTLLEKRARFIAEKQQYHCQGSPLDGAYLIYDDRSDSLYYDAGFTDHNAGRERVAFGMAVARALRRQYDEALHTSLMKYVAFVERELLDTDTGVVYNEIQKTQNWNRLCNYPWFSHFYFELYKLEGQPRYLEIAGRILWSACSQAVPDDGRGFRYGTIVIGETVRELEKVGYSELARSILELLRRFGDFTVEAVQSVNIRPYGREDSLEAGTLYCDFSDLIVLYDLTGEDKYRQVALECCRIARQTTGWQPDYRLHGNALRYWEGYWFGSDKRYGDVFPHMWEALPSTAYYQYKLATGDDRFDRDMLNNCRSVLALYRGDGFASHAYHYYFEFRGIDTMENNPYEFKTLGSYWGRYFDRWSNDQDWAIVYADIIENGY